MKGGACLWVVEHFDSVGRGVGVCMYNFIFTISMQHKFGNTIITLFHEIVAAMEHVKHNEISDLIVLSITSTSVRLDHL